MRRAAALLLLAAGLPSLTACSYFRAAPPTYNVFFGDRSARIDEPAQTTIVEAARVANSRPSDPVILGGFADAKSVNAKAAQALAKERVEAVVQALTTIGVSSGRIQRAPYAVDPEAQAGVDSRRVEIDIGR